jgi:hypothetical protein
MRTMLALAAALLILSACSRDADSGTNDEYIQCRTMCSERSAMEQAEMMLFICPVTDGYVCTCAYEGEPLMCDRILAFTPEGEQLVR